MLCLDGGGSRGLVMAMMMQNLEEKMNHEEFHGGRNPAHCVCMYELFDLVAGTWGIPGPG